MAKKTKSHVGFDLIEQKLVNAKMSYVSGDVANAAGYMHEAAKMAVSLADEIRYDHGVKAGKAQATRDIKARLRKARREGN